ncbi:MmgE/PrpD family protein [Chloroflexota bacterium]
MTEASAQKDVAYAFAKNVVETKFEDLPPKAVDAAKKGVIDTLGVILAASGVIPSLNGVVEVVREMGGNPESTIIAFGGKAPACMAAFANGAMAHCMDYDDIEHSTTYHPSSAVVPAGLAIAERNRPVNGKDFITAIALGQDLGIRLAKSIPAKRKPPWHRTALLSIFASAATAAKILNLDEEGVVDALGLAFCQSSGTLELRWGVGTDIGGMYPAFPAKGGVLSALLAQKGVAGIKSCFEGKAGLFNTYFDGNYDRSKLTSGLGSEFTGADTALKPWPACAANHTYIDAALNLLDEHTITHQDIDHIVIHVGDWAQTLCEPLPARQKPASALDAKFSLPFCISVATVQGNVVLDDFISSSLTDPKVLEMAQKVKPKLDDRLNITESGLPPGVVEIHTKQGKTFSKEVSKPLGHPENPITWEAINDKFRDCSRHAVRPLPEQNADRVIEFVQKLERVGDVADISQWLAATVIS